MRSDEELAAALFPTMPQEQPAQQHRPAGRASTPPPQRTDEERANRLFDTAEHYQDLVSDEARPGGLHVSAEALAKLGLDHSDAKVLMSRLRDAHQNPPTDMDRARWRHAAEKRIAEMDYQPGDVEAAKNLALSDPWISRLLSETGVGSQPEIVEMMIGAARTARSRGRKL